LGPIDSFWSINLWKTALVIELQNFDYLVCVIPLEISSAMHSPRPVCIEQLFTKSLRPNRLRVTPQERRRLDNGRGEILKTDHKRLRSRNLGGFEFSSASD
jgi:hypothetical protein